MIYYTYYDAPHEPKSAYVVCERCGEMTTKFNLDHAPMCFAELLTWADR